MAFYIFCEIYKLVNGDTKFKEVDLVKEFFRKTWAVTRMWAYMLGYTLIGLPYIMWKIAQVIFEKEDVTNADADTIIQEVAGVLKDL